MKISTIPFIKKILNKEPAFNAKEQSDAESNQKVISVAAKLNVVNVLIFISGILSIVGAYEIQLGGKMHELNYFHQKYITFLVKNVKEFEETTVAVDALETNVLNIRNQPITCLKLAGPFELFMMDVIGTSDTIKLCEDDLEIADKLLAEIGAYKKGELGKQLLIPILHKAISDFENSGIKFEPLVGKTVNIIFLIVISIVVGKAFIVPTLGIFLSTSVARDYRLLTITKNDLEKEKQRNALIQAERISSLTTMVAGMAHEINTPVGVSVTANSCVEELLKTLNDDYETGKLTESKFHKSIKEMDNMNKMLASNLRRTATLIESFKQVSVNQSIDKIQKVNIKNYIEQIWMSLTPLTKSSNITFTLNCDSMLEASIYTGALSQIITNLVTNAVSHAFIDINKPSITLSVKELANNECKMSFQDNGNGIPADNVVHIFDPFFTTKRGHGGTGLGLHILHNLVTDKLHGRVICTSKVNVGTSFDIFFSKEGKE